MRKYWRLYIAKFAALSVRERVMVYAAAAVLVIFIADTLFLGPLSQRRNSVAALVQSQHEEIDTLEQQLGDLRARKAADPDAAAKARIGQIEQQIGAIDRNLKSVQDTLVPPERMATLLRELVTQNRRLDLVALKTIPVTPLIDRARQAAERQAAAAAAGAGAGAGDAAAADGANAGNAGGSAVPPVDGALPPGTAAAAARGEAEQPEANIFKHGVEITLAGSYPDFVAYLEAIERLPWQMYWGGLKVDAADYPRVTLVLTLYTLSLDPAWLKL